MFEFLKGKKTYFVAALGVIILGAKAMGYITDDQFKAVETILGFLGLSFLRAAVQPTYIYDFSEQDLEASKEK